MSPEPSCSWRNVWPWWLAAIVLTAAGCLEWWWIQHHDAGDALALLSAIAAQLVVGREGGIPIGLVGGASPWLVWQYSVMEDIVETLIGIGAAWWLLRPQRPASRAPVWFGHVQGSIAPRLAALGKWRAMGLFAFTLVPFMLNGPVIAAVAGRMSGLGTRATFLAIASGSLVAGTTWTLASVGVTSLVPNRLLLSAAALMVAAVLARATWRRFTGAPHSHASGNLSNSVRDRSSMATGLTPHRARIWEPPPASPAHPSGRPVERTRFRRPARRPSRPNPTPHTTTT